MYIQYFMPIHAFSNNLDRDKWRFFETVAFNTFLDTKVTY